MNWENTTLICEMLRYEFKQFPFPKKLIRFRNLGVGNSMFSIWECATNETFGNKISPDEKLHSPFFLGGFIK